MFWGCLSKRALLFSLWGSGLAVFEGSWNQKTLFVESQRNSMTMCITQWIEEEIYYVVSRPHFVGNWVPNMDFICNGGIVVTYEIMILKTSLAWKFTKLCHFFKTYYCSSNFDVEFTLWFNVLQFTGLWANADPFSFTLKSP